MPCCASCGIALPVSSPRAGSPSKLAGRSTHAALQRRAAVGAHWPAKYTASPEHAPAAHHPLLTMQDVKFTVQQLKRHSTKMRPGCALSLQARVILPSSSLNKPLPACLRRQEFFGLLEPGVKAGKSQGTGRTGFAMLPGPPRVLHSLLSLSCRAGRLPRFGCVCCSEAGGAPAFTAAVRGCWTGALFSMPNCIVD